MFATLCEMEWNAQAPKFWESILGYHLPKRKTVGFFGLAGWPVTDVLVLCSLCWCVSAALLVLSAFPRGLGRFCCLRGLHILPCPLLYCVIPTLHNMKWVTDKIWYMAKGQPQVEWAPFGFAVAAPNLLEGIVLGIVLGWAPIIPDRFCSDGNPRTLSILLWSYLILSDTEMVL